jgi:23S rRNA-/tRNA-specific pseudouridylate synthase
MIQHFLDKPLTIVYRDEYLMAVYKYEGLWVYKSNIDKWNALPAKNAM